jgi:3',5'-cyclic-AMP phosphodiesterase
MLLAQISDLHVTAAGHRLFDRLDTGAYLARAIDHLKGLRPRPDLVLVTGDLVDGGAVSEYEHLRARLAALDLPYRLMPGNHDDRGSLRAVFADHRYLRAGTFMNYVVDEFPLRIIALDTVVAGETGGLLCRERLAWLEARLAEAPAEPTVIAMHHPPFVSGIAEMDAINCANSAALGAIVARNPQIERILCGHIHRPICLRWHGTVVTTAPGTAHQVALDVDPDAPVSWILEPPACHLHHWWPEDGLVTHVSYIGDYGPAHAYG